MAQVRAARGSGHCLPVHLLAMALLLSSSCVQSARDSGHHRKIVIHVPYYIKNLHHTHTVFKYVKDHRQHPGEAALDGEDPEQHDQDELEAQDFEEDGHIGELQYGQHFDQEDVGAHPHAHYHTTFLVRHNDGHLLQDEDSHESHEVIGHGGHQQEHYQQQHNYHPHHTQDDDYPDAELQDDGDDNNSMRQESLEQQQQQLQLQQHPHQQQQFNYDKSQQHELLHEDQHGGLYRHQQHPDRRRRRRRRHHKRPQLDLELRPPLMQPQPQAVRKVAVLIGKPPGRRKSIAHAAHAWRLGY